MIICHTDGSCEPQNPNGIATWGFVIDIRENGAYANIKDCGVVGVGKGMTNQVAEYAALVNCLKKLLDKGLQAEDIIIYSDSEMLVRQMRSELGANKGEYLQYFFQARGFDLLFTNLKYQWVPRETNKEADQLTRDAYIGYCKAHGLKTKFIKRHKKRDGHGKRISR